MRVPTRQIRSQRRRLFRGRADRAAALAELAPSPARGTGLGSACSRCAFEEFTAVVLASHSRSAFEIHFLRYGQTDRFWANRRIRLPDVAELILKAAVEESHYGLRLVCGPPLDGLGLLPHELND